MESDEQSSTGAFWGISMSVGKKYSQVVQSPFHISMAVLYLTEYPSRLDRSEACTVKVILEYKENMFLLCCLNPMTILQQPLNLNFSSGESVKFHISCADNRAKHYQVHLSGYSMFKDSYEDQSSTLDDENKDFRNFFKQLSGMSSLYNDDENEDNDRANNDDRIFDNDEYDDNIEEEPAVNEKQIKRKKKVNKNTSKNKKQKTTSFEELKIGKGQEAESTSRVHIYYTGKTEDGTVFSKHTEGKPLAFFLNDNSMMKGWSVGIVGMRVGGKRRLTIPPSESKTSNGDRGFTDKTTTLIYDIELKAISPSG
ncbi:hypothetical protein GJ496_005852 [Pomphorhynchus laevis]|nr:hypothetical protein GJ496_005852 [Pomphorhynchus laevis]